MFLRKHVHILNQKSRKDQFYARGVNFFIKNHVFLRKQIDILNQKSRKDPFCARGVNFLIKTACFFVVDLTFCVCSFDLRFSMPY